MGVEELIRFNRVVKVYGRNLGLNDVSMVIGKGITGFIGPNGAGKSTFMKLCMGLIRPTLGSVEVMGRNPWDCPEVMRQLGYCPEYEMLYSEMSARKALVYHLLLQGFERKEAGKRSREYLELLGLKESMDRAVKGYSSGMKQRLKVAMAMAHEPALLMLDEPLAGMDPIGKAAILESLSEWAKKGGGVVISSHLLPEVEKITDNIVLINRGRLIARGNLHEIRGLIDRYPQRILFETVDVRGLAKLLLDLPYIEGVTVAGERQVYAYTRHPEPFYRDIAGLLHRNRIHIAHMSSPDDNLNAVFSYLVG